MLNKNYSFKICIMNILIFCWYHIIYKSTQFNFETRFYKKLNILYWWTGKSVIRSKQCDWKVRIACLLDHMVAWWKGNPYYLWVEKETFHIHTLLARVKCPLACYLQYKKLKSQDQAIDFSSVLWLELGDLLIFVCVYIF